MIAAAGDPGLVCLFRSSAKPIQALPLARARPDLDDREIAIACASHRAEPAQIAAVRSLLAKAPASEGDLECGEQEDRPPGPIHHNCSGKHAGFLTLAQHLRVPTAGYIRPEHPVQQLVTAALAEVAEVELDPAHAGIDGCGIPVHPMPLRALAGAGARFAAPPSTWAPERADAARRLGAAMVAEPWYVDGTRRLCTDLLRAADGEVLVKVGAEGVQLAALPRLRLGIAVKVEDGATRASEVALGHVLAAMGCDGARTVEVFDRRRRITNWAGTHVADLRVIDTTP